MGICQLGNQSKTPNWGLNLLGPFFISAGKAGIEFIQESLRNNTTQNFPTLSSLVYHTLKGVETSEERGGKFEWIHTGLYFFPLAHFPTFQCGVK